MFWQRLKSWFTKKPPAAPLGDHMKFGEWGEEIAADFLRKQGHMILERRFRVSSLKGEIDLITRDPRDRNCLVFVEVKTRRSKDFAPAEFAVHSGKRRAMIRMSKSYARRFRRAVPRRFDVISVYPCPETGGDPVVEHFPNAFREKPRWQFRRWRR